MPKDCHKCEDTPIRFCPACGDSIWLLVEGGAQCYSCGEFVSYEAVEALPLSCACDQGDGGDTIQLEPAKPTIEPGGINAMLADMERRAQEGMGNHGVE